jgi:hypothetical protein
LLAVQSSAGLASAEGAGGAANEPASNKVVCEQAFEQAQGLQRDSKYLAANREVLKCANPTCGEVIFSECSKMYQDLQAAIPTLVFSARDAQTNTDRSDVIVSMDGQEIARRLEGKPVPIDPGSHRFKFSILGRNPVEQTLVIVAGEKFRQTSVVFEATAPSAGGSEPVSANRGRSIPTASYVLGGVGLAGLGAFGVLRLLASSDYNSTEERCSPACPQSDLDRIKTKYAISNVAAGVGGAALAGALVVYFATPRNSHDAALRFEPTSAGGFSARLVTRF